MNREIKFRGMCISGHWYYGNLAILKKKVDHIEAGSYISNSVGVPFAYRVRPETVGEFTGLKDAKGVEIYEGDIVMDAEIGQNEIKWADDLDGWRYSTRGLCHGYIDSGHCEVIGNIFEHGESLCPLEKLQDEFSAYCLSHKHCADCEKERCVLTFMLAREQKLKSEAVKVVEELKEPLLIKTKFNDNLWEFNGRVDKAIKKIEGM